MPPAKPSAFRKAITGGQVAPAYLLHGDDDFLKEHAVRFAVDALVDRATRDFNLEVRRAADLDAESLHSLLNTPPMMADRRVVVLREVSGLKKPALEVLTRYLERPAPDLVLLMTLPAGTKVEKAMADVARASTEVEFRPLTGEHLPRWVEHHAAELGGSIARDAAELLISAVGEDTAALDAELGKLLAYTGGAEIGREAVEAIVGVRHGETMGDLLDAVLERNARRALELLPIVLAQPKVSEVQVVMALTTQTLAMAWARAARDEGMSASQLEREFYNLLREGGAYPGRAWGEAVKAWARALPRWSAAALDRALDALVLADVSLKETTVSDQGQILASCLLAICAAETGARPARTAA